MMMLVKESIRKVEAEASVDLPAIQIAAKATSRWDPEKCWHQDAEILVEKDY